MLSRTTRADDIKYKRKTLRNGENKAEAILGRLGQVLTVVIPVNVLSALVCFHETISI